MSIEKIHLRTLLKYFGLSQERRIAAVRSDARAEIRKRNGGSTGGGDFHSPFWADAKAHVAGGIDLLASTEDRVDKNGTRERLYPALTKGFLSWWNGKRRWTNEPIVALPELVKAPYHFSEIDGIVKVENLLALKVGQEETRLIYPYFSEVPILSEEVARLGLWLMKQALPAYNIDDMRVLDVLRGETYSIDRYPLLGNEGAIFVERYARMLNDWRKYIRDFTD